MNLDPSDGEGLRTSSTSDRASDGASDPHRPTIARASLGWSLVLIGVLIGFSVGGRIGSAEDRAVVSGRASASNTTTIRATRRTLAEEVMAAVAAREEALRSSGHDPDSIRVSAPLPDVESYDVASQDVAPHDVASHDVKKSGSLVDAAYALASRGQPIPIEALPIYVDEFSDEFAEDFSADHTDEQADEHADGLLSHDPGEPLTIVTRGQIGRGESLGSSLRRQGIKPTTVHLIAKEMRKVFDFRRSRPGDEYRLGQDSDGRVLDFRYSQSEEESYYLAWNGTRYTATKETAKLRPQIAKIAGIVDSSFYGAVLALGEQSALAAEFTRILAWDIDFSRSVHSGDEFQILYERLYRRGADGKEVYVKPGRILAGRYEGQSGEHTVVYFEGAGEDGRGAYFRPDGSSIERAFLAAPLAFSRITSRFSWARKHPILKITRPHPGIDYAAALGTPVWAVASGVVEYKARAGASGNLIRIRHQGGLTSHYAHLASFAKGLKVGDRVDQKQVIGYVGSTGLSTGPHVCFRVKRDGKYIDPMSISGPAGEPVAPSQLAMFRTVRDQLLTELGPGPLNVANEAL